VLGLSRKPPVARFGLRLNTRLSRALGLDVSVARSQFELGRWEHNVFSTLTWSLPAEHFAQLSEHTGPSGSDLTGQLSRSVSGPTGIGYQLSGSVGAVRRATASVQAQAPFGRLAGTYINQAGAPSTLLEASGGMVFLAGKLHFTRPVSQSFALLRVPGIENVRGYLNNREVGRTDSSGELFVPDLASYLSNRLRINQADLPLEVQFEQDEVALAPPARGGAVITFAVRPVHFARGRIVRGWQRFPPPVKYGTLTLQTPAGALSSPLGSNGEFELDGVPGGRFTGQVQSPEGDCQISVDMPVSNAPIQYLGTLLCTPLDGQAPPGALP
ncbi:MAG: fimbria/pilus outer membrane usher protein, partial [Deltaproteobacteria bacterium]